MHLVVGLGNPGPRYSRTRHNIGALTVARAFELWAVARRYGDEAEWGRGRVGSVEMILATPMAWMNQSGPVVRGLLERHGAAPQDLVVVHDDLDLALGRLRIKREGGTGGHNGLLSIISTLETDQFCRLKIGIGNPPTGVDPADYVLSPFLPEELTRVETILDRAVEALECQIAEGVEAAMNRFNVREIVS